MAAKQCPKRKAGKTENSGGQRKVIGRPWPKGTSGNPGGRPKGSQEIAELARSHSVECINRLLEISRNENISAPARILATNSMLDRAFGKPKLQGEIMHTHEFDDWSAAQLRAYIQRESLKLGIFQIEGEALEEASELPSLPPPR